MTVTEPGCELWHHMLERRGDRKRLFWPDDDVDAINANADVWDTVTDNAANALSLAATAANNLNQRGVWQDSMAAAWKSHIVDVNTANKDFVDAFAGIAGSYRSYATYVDKVRQQIKDFVDKQDGIFRRIHWIAGTGTAFARDRFAEAVVGKVEAMVKEAAGNLYMPVEAPEEPEKPDPGRSSLLMGIPLGLYDSYKSLILATGGLIGYGEGGWSWYNAITAWDGLYTLIGAAATYTSWQGILLDQTVGFPTFARGELGSVLWATGKTMTGFDEKGASWTYHLAYTAATISTFVGTKGGAGIAMRVMRPLRATGLGSRVYLAAAAVREFHPVQTAAVRTLDRMLPEQFRADAGRVPGHLDSGSRPGTAGGGAGAGTDVPARSAASSEARAPGSAASTTETPARRAAGEPEAARQQRPATAEEPAAASQAPSRPQSGPRPGPPGNAGPHQGPATPAVNAGGGAGHGAVHPAEGNPSPGGVPSAAGKGGAPAHGGSPATLSGAHLGSGAEVTPGAHPRQPGLPGGEPSRAPVDAAARQVAGEPLARPEPVARPEAGRPPHASEPGVVGSHAASAESPRGGRTPEVAGDAAGSAARRDASGGADRPVAAEGARPAAEGPARADDAAVARDAARNRHWWSRFLPGSRGPEVVTAYGAEWARQTDGSFRARGESFLDVAGRAEPVRLSEGALSVIDRNGQLRLVTDDGHIYHRGLPREGKLSETWSEHGAPSDMVVESIEQGVSLKLADGSDLVITKGDAIRHVDGTELTYRSHATGLTYVPDGNGRWVDARARPAEVDAWLAGAHHRFDTARIMHDIDAQADRMRGLPRPELGRLARTGNAAERMAAVYELLHRADPKKYPRWTQVEAVNGFMNGRTVNMLAGEGKSMAYRFHAVVKAAEGEVVHFLTSRDTLATREFREFEHLLRDLDFDLHRMNPEGDVPVARRGRPTVYVGTVDDAAFSYLRDKEIRGTLAIVDEIDEVLVYADSTFVISDGVLVPATDAVRAQVVWARDLVESGWLTERDFGRLPGDWAPSPLHLTPEGLAKVQEVLRGARPTAEQLHRLHNAAKAKWDLKVNEHYLVSSMEAGENRRIIIISNATHKLMNDPSATTAGHGLRESRWSDGLAQAVEAREGLVIRGDARISKQVTAGELFKRYETVVGASGTAMGHGEVFGRRGLSPVVHDVPSYYTSKLVRDPDVVSATRAETFDRMAEDTRDMHFGGEGGKPDGAPQVLIGVENGDVWQISRRLSALEVPHVAVDARWFELKGVKAEEALQQIFDEAGEQGRVVVINMQGARGVDIRPTLAALEQGGLHVRISGHSEVSHSIDIQAERRAARSGEPGHVTFYTSHEDAVFRQSHHPEAPVVVMEVEAAVEHQHAVAAEYKANASEGNLAKLDLVNERLGMAQLRLVDLVPDLQQTAAAIHQHRIMGLSGVPKPADAAPQQQPPQAPGVTAGDPSASTPHGGTPADGSGVEGDQGQAPAQTSGDQTPQPAHDSPAGTPAASGEASSDAAVANQPVTAAEARAHWHEVLPLLADRPGAEYARAELREQLFGWFADGDEPGHAIAQIARVIGAEFPGNQHPVAASLDVLAELHELSAAPTARLPATLSAAIGESVADILMTAPIAAGLVRSEATRRLIAEVQETGTLAKPESGTPVPASPAILPLREQVQALNRAADRAQAKGRPDVARHLRQMAAQAATAADRRPAPQDDAPDAQQAQADTALVGAGQAGPPITATFVPGTRTTEGMLSQPAADLIAAAFRDGIRRQVVSNSLIREVRLVEEPDGDGGVRVDPEGRLIAGLVEVELRDGSALTATVTVGEAGELRAGSLFPIGPSAERRASDVTVVLSAVHPAGADVVTTFVHEMFEVISTLRRSPWHSLNAAPQRHLLTPSAAPLSDDAQLSHHDVGGIGDIQHLVTRLVTVTVPAERAALIRDLTAHLDHLGLGDTAPNALALWDLVDAVVPFEELTVEQQRLYLLLRTPGWQQQAQEGTGSEHEAVMDVLAELYTKPGTDAPTKLALERAFLVQMLYAGGWRQGDPLALWTDAQWLYARLAAWHGTGYRPSTLPQEDIALRTHERLPDLDAVHELAAAFDAYRGANAGDDAQRARADFEERLDEFLRGNTARIAATLAADGVAEHRIGLDATLSQAQREHQAALLLEQSSTKLREQAATEQAAATRIAQDGDADGARAHDQLAAEHELLAEQHLASANKLRDSVSAGVHRAAAAHQRAMAQAREQWLGPQPAAVDPLSGLDAGLQWAVADALASIPFVNARPGQPGVVTVALPGHAPMDLTIRFGPSAGMGADVTVPLHPADAALRDPRRVIAERTVAAVAEAVLAHGPDGRGRIGSTSTATLAWAVLDQLVLRDAVLRAAELLADPGTPAAVRTATEELLHELRTELHRNERRLAEQLQAADVADPARYVRLRTEVGAWAAPSGWSAEAMALLNQIRAAGPPAASAHAETPTQAETSTQPVAAAQQPDRAAPVQQDSDPAEPVAATDAAAQSVGHLSGLTVEQLADEIGGLAPDSPLLPATRRALALAVLRQAVHAANLRSDAFIMLRQDGTPTLRVRRAPARASGERFLDASRLVRELADLSGHVDHHQLRVTAAVRLTTLLGRGRPGPFGRRAAKLEARTQRQVTVAVAELAADPRAPQHTRDAARQTLASRLRHRPDAADPAVPPLLSPPARSVYELVSAAMRDQSSLTLPARPGPELGTGEVDAAHAELRQAPSDAHLDTLAGAVDRLLERHQVERDLYLGILDEAAAEHVQMIEHLRAAQTAVREPGQPGLGAVLVQARRHWQGVEQRRAGLYAAVERADEIMATMRPLLAARPGADQAHTELRNWLFGVLADGVSPQVAVTQFAIAVGAAFPGEADPVVGALDSLAALHAMPESPTRVILEATTEILSAAPATLAAVRLPETRRLIAAAERAGATVDPYSALRLGNTDPALAAVHSAVQRLSDGADIATLEVLGGALATAVTMMTAAAEGLRVRQAVHQKAATAPSTPQTPGEKETPEQEEQRQNRERHGRMLRWYEAAAVEAQTIADALRQARDAWYSTMDRLDDPATVARETAAIIAAAAVAHARYEPYRQALQPTRPIQEALQSAVAHGRLPQMAELVAVINGYLPKDAHLRPEELERVLRSAWRGVAGDDGQMLAIGIDESNIIGFKVRFDHGELVEVADPMTTISELMIGQIPTFVQNSRVLADARSRSVGWSGRVDLGGVVGGFLSQVQHLIPADAPFQWLQWIRAGAMWGELFAKDHVIAEGNAGGSRATSKRVVGADFTMPGGVMDNRGESTEYDADGRWELQVRAGDAKDWQDVAFEPVGKARVQLALAHPFTEPVQDDELAPPDEPETDIPEHAVLALDGLNELYDQVIAALGDRAPTGGVAREQVRALLLELYPARLQQTINGPFELSAVITDDGGNPASVSIRTDEHRDRAERVGNRSRKVHLEWLRVTFSQAAAEFGLNGSWQGGAAVGLKWAMNKLGVAWLAERLAGESGRVAFSAAGGTGRQVSAGAGGNAIHPSVQRYSGYTQTYKIPVTHVATVDLGDGAPQPTHCITEGSGLFVIPEPYAYRAGLPVSAAAKDKARSEKAGKLVLVDDLDESPPPGRRGEAPNWRTADGALMPGVGQGLAQDLKGVDGNDELRELVTRALQSGGNRPGGVRPFLPVDPKKAEAMLQELSAMRLEGSYDQATQDGVFIVLVNEHGERETVRVQIKERQVRYLGHSRAWTEVNLDIDSESASRGRGQTGQLKPFGMSAGMAGDHAGHRDVDFDSAGAGYGYTRRRGGSFNDGETANQVLLGESGADGTARFEVVIDIVASVEHPDGHWAELARVNNQKVELVTSVGHLPEATTERVLTPEGPAVTPRSVLNRAAIRHLDATGMLEAGVRALGGGPRTGTGAFAHLVSALNVRSLVAAGATLFSSAFGQGIGYRTDLIGYEAPERRSSWRNIVDNSHATVKVEAVPGASTFSGAGDGVVGDIHLALRSNSAGMSRDTEHSADASGGRGLHTGEDRVHGTDGGGVSGSRSHGASHTLTQITGEEGLIIYLGQHYTYTMPVDFRVTGVRHDQGDDGIQMKQLPPRTVVYSLPERDALDLYGMGDLPVPLHQLTDALTRYANGKLELDRASAVRIVNRFQRDLRDAQLRVGEDAYPANLPDPGLPRTEEFARNLHARLVEQFPEVPAVEGAELPAYAAALEAAIAGDPRLRAMPEGGALPEHLLAGVGQNRFSLIDLNGEELFAEVMRGIEAVSPGAERRNIGLWRNFYGRLAGRRWWGKLEDMLSPGGWAVSVPVMAGNMTGEEITVRIKASLGDGEAIGKSTDVGRILQRYAYEMKDRGESVGWSRGASASGSGAGPKGTEPDGISGGVSAGNSRGRRGFVGEQLTRLQRQASFGPAVRFRRPATVVVEVTRSRPQLLDRAVLGVVGLRHLRSRPKAAWQRELRGEAIQLVSAEQVDVGTAARPNLAELDLAAPANPHAVRLPYEFSVESSYNGGLAQQIMHHLGKLGWLGSDAKRLRLEVERVFLPLMYNALLEKMHDPGGHLVLRLPVPTAPLWNQPFRRTGTATTVIEIVVEAKFLDPRVIRELTEMIEIGIVDRAQHTSGWSISKGWSAGGRFGFSFPAKPWNVLGKFGFTTPSWGRDGSYGFGGSDEHTWVQGDRDETSLFAKALGHLLAFRVDHVVTLRMVEHRRRGSGIERKVAREVQLQPASSGRAYITMFSQDAKKLLKRWQEDTDRPWPWWIAAQQPMPAGRTERMRAWLRRTDVAVPAFDLTDLFADAVGHPEFRPVNPLPAIVATVRDRIGRGDRVVHLHAVQPSAGALDPTWVASEIARTAGVHVVVEVRRRNGVLRRFRATPDGRVRPELPLSAGDALPLPRTAATPPTRGPHTPADPGAFPASAPAEPRRSLIDGVLGGHPEPAPDAAAEHRAEAVAAGRQAMAEAAIAAAVPELTGSGLLDRADLADRDAAALVVRTTDGETVHLSVANEVAALAGTDAVGERLRLLAVTMLTTAVAAVLNGRLGDPYRTAAQVLIHGYEAAPVEERDDWRHALLDLAPALTYADLVTLLERPLPRGVAEALRAPTVEAAITETLALLTGPGMPLAAEIAPGPAGTMLLTGPDGPVREMRAEQLAALRERLVARMARGAGVHRIRADAAAILGADADLNSGSGWSRVEGALVALGRLWTDDPGTAAADVAPVPAPGDPRTPAQVAVELAAAEVLADHAPTTWRRGALPPAARALVDQVDPAPETVPSPAARRFHHPGYPAGLTHGRPWTDPAVDWSAALHSETALRALLRETGLSWYDARLLLIDLDLLPADARPLRLRDVSRIVEADRVRSDIAAALQATVDHAVREFERLVRGLAPADSSARSQRRAQLIAEHVAAGTMTAELRATLVEQILADEVRARQWQILGQHYGPYELRAMPSYHLDGQAPRSADPDGITVPTITLDRVVDGQPVVVHTYRLRTGPVTFGQDATYRSNTFTRSLFRPETLRPTRTPEPQPVAGPSPVDPQIAATWVPGTLDTWGMAPQQDTHPRDRVRRIETSARIAEALQEQLQRVNDTGYRDAIIHEVRLLHAGDHPTADTSHQATGDVVAGVLEVQPWSPYAWSTDRLRVTVAVGYASGKRAISYVTLPSAAGQPVNVTVVLSWQHPAGRGLVGTLMHELGEVDRQLRRHRLWWRPDAAPQGNLLATGAPASAAEAGLSDHDWGGIAGLLELTGRILATPAGSAERAELVGDLWAHLEYLGLGLENEDSVALWDRFDAVVRVERLIPAQQELLRSLREPGWRQSAIMAPPAPLALPAGATAHAVQDALPRPLPPLAHKRSRATDLVANRSTGKPQPQDDPDSPADEWLAAVSDQQGFGDPPTVMSPWAMNRQMFTGDYFEIWRGTMSTADTTAAEFNEQLRRGPAQYGEAPVNGALYAFVADPDAAATDSDGTAGSVVRALLPKSAKIATYEALKALAEPQPYVFGKRMAFADVARHAVAAGIDAVVFPGGVRRGELTTDGILVVNRSILIVEEEPGKAEPAGYDGGGPERGVPASDADRRAVEQWYATLVAAGRLTVDEFDVLAIAAYAARTLADLDGLVRDMRRSLRPTDQDRVAAAELLGEQVGAGWLTLSDFQNWLELVQAASTLHELETLLAGFPDLSPPPVDPALPYKPSRARNLVPDEFAADRLDRRLMHQPYVYSGAWDWDWQYAMIAAWQGFDGTPTVVDRQTMKSLRRSGDFIEVWHGAKRGPEGTAAQVHDDFRHGPVAYDHTFVQYYGEWRIDGYLCAVRARRTIADRTPDSNLRVLIPRAAKIGDYRRVAYDSGLLDSKELVRYLSRHAAAVGYDAIIVPGVTEKDDVYVLLNREIAIVEEASTRPGPALRSAEPTVAATWVPGTRAEKRRLLPGPSAVELAGSLRARLARQRVSDSVIHEMRLVDAGVGVDADGRAVAGVVEVDLRDGSALTVTVVVGDAGERAKSAFPEGERASVMTAVISAELLDGGDQVGALVHEVWEVVARRGRSWWSVGSRRDQLMAEGGVPGRWARLSAHDHGGVGDLQDLAARVVASVDVVQRAALIADLAAHLDHLGLAAGTPRAARLWQLVDAEVSTEHLSLAVLELFESLREEGWQDAAKARSVTASAIVGVLPDLIEALAPERAVEPEAEPAEELRVPAAAAARFHAPRNRARFTSTRPWIEPTDEWTAAVRNESALRALIRASGRSWYDVRLFLLDHGLLPEDARPLRVRDVARAVDANKVREDIAGRLQEALDDAVREFERQALGLRPAATNARSDRRARAIAEHVASGTMTAQLRASFIEQIFADEVRARQWQILGEHYGRYQLRALPSYGLNGQDPRSQWTGPTVTLDLMVDGQPVVVHSYRVDAGSDRQWAHQNATYTRGLFEADDLRPTDRPPAAEPTPPSPVDPVAPQQRAALAEVAEILSREPGWQASLTLGDGPARLAVEAEGQPVRVVVTPDDTAEERPGERSGPAVAEVRISPAQLDDPVRAAETVAAAVIMGTFDPFRMFGRHPDSAPASPPDPAVDPVRLQTLLYAIDQAGRLERSPFRDRLLVGFLVEVHALLHRGPGLDRFDAGLGPVELEWLRQLRRPRPEGEEWAFESEVLRHLTGVSDWATVGATGALSARLTEVAHREERDDQLLRQARSAAQALSATQWQRAADAAGMAQSDRTVLLDTVEQAQQALTQAQQAFAGPVGASEAMRADARAVTRGAVPDAGTRSEYERTRAALEEHVAAAGLAVDTADLLEQSPRLRRTAAGGEAETWVQDLVSSTRQLLLDALGRLGGRGQWQLAQRWQQLERPAQAHLSGADLEVLKGLAEFYKHDPAGPRPAPPAADPAEEEAARAEYENHWQRLLARWDAEHAGIRAGLARRAHDGEVAAAWAAELAAIEDLAGARNASTVVADADQRLQEAVAAASSAQQDAVATARRKLDRELFSAGNATARARRHHQESVAEHALAADPDVTAAQAALAHATSQLDQARGRRRAVQVTVSRTQHWTQPGSGRLATNRVEVAQWRQTVRDAERGLEQARAQVEQYALKRRDAAVRAAQDDDAKARERFNSAVADAEQRHDGIQPGTHLVSAQRWEGGGWWPVGLAERAAEIRSTRRRRPAGSRCRPRRRSSPRSCWTSSVSGCCRGVGSAPSR
ncbi:DUF1707 domain-containing protein [Dactylosporangium sp. NPDC049742]|uniref:DUF1707 domain-containing protein n=1 Tax=Dactylosporangium sp. NPDC049742 TaxID=3154737 RepID=UPI00342ECEF5